jgi:hypothetical protein
MAGARGVAGLRGSVACEEAARAESRNVARRDHDKINVCSNKEKTSLHAGFTMPPGEFWPRPIRSTMVDLERIALPDETPGARGSFPVNDWRRRHE